MVFTTVKVAFSKLLVVILFNEIALSCVKNVMISMEFFALLYLKKYILALENGNFPQSFSTDVQLI